MFPDNFVRLKPASAATVTTTTSKPQKPPPPNPTPPVVTRATGTLSDPPVVTRATGTCILCNGHHNILIPPPPSPLPPLPLLSLRQNTDQTAKSRRAMVTFSYTAENTDELTLQPGQVREGRLRGCGLTFAPTTVSGSAGGRGGWLVEGTAGGKRGIVPIQLCGDKHQGDHTPRGAPGVSSGPSDYNRWPPSDST